MELRTALSHLKFQSITGKFSPALEVFIDSASAPQRDVLSVAFENHNLRIEGVAESFINQTIEKVGSSTLHLRLLPDAFLIGTKDWCHRLTFRYPPRTQGWMEIFSAIAERVLPPDLIVSIESPVDQPWFDGFFSKIASSLPDLRHLRLVGEGPHIESDIRKIFGTTMSSSGTMQSRAFERLEVFGLDNSLSSIAPTKLSRLLQKADNRYLQAIEVSSHGLRVGGDYAMESRTSWEELRLEELRESLEPLQIAVRVVNEPSLAPWN